MRHEWPHLDGKETVQVASLNDIGIGIWGANDKGLLGVADNWEDA